MTTSTAAATSALSQLAAAEAADWLMAAYRRTGGGLPAQAASTPAHPGCEADFRDCYDTRY